MNRCNRCRREIVLKDLGRFVDGIWYSLGTWVHKDDETRTCGTITAKPEEKSGGSITFVVEDAARGGQFAVSMIHNGIEDVPTAEIPPGASITIALHVSNPELRRVIARDLRTLIEQVLRTPKNI